jgi:hypothetical protein
LKLLLALSAVVCSVLVATSTAQASTKRHAPYWFVKEARCVHSHEAGAWKWTPTYHPGYTYWNHYWTGMQFVKSTWHTANVYLHMRTSPYTGNVRLIILHAYVIVRAAGGRWSAWPNTARMCGLPT